MLAPMMVRRRLPVLTGLVAALLGLGACGLGGGAGGGDLVVGAIYPVSGSQAEGGQEELDGVRTALELAQPGLGRRVQIRLVPVETPEGAIRAVDTLVDSLHVPVIIGTYGSTLAEAAAARADQRHVVYWETGAVSDGVTRNRSWVFRTVATGSSLGRTAVDFTSSVLVPASGLPASSTRAVIVHVDDPYGDSVAAGEVEQAAGAGIPVVANIAYDPNRADVVALAAAIAAARPDYLWDVSYLDDGIALWSAVLRSGIHLRASVGTSSAYCMPDFGARLGASAVGLFAADKPNHAVSPQALTAAAAALLGRAEAAYARRAPSEPDMEIPAIAGFVGGWALFHDVLPGLGADLTPAAIRAAAQRLDQPAGSTISGGGIRFAAPGRPDAGQNLRAAAVVGQWQAVNTMRVVFPAGYATAPPRIP